MLDLDEAAMGMNDVVEWIDFSFHLDSVTAWGKADKDGRFENCTEIYIGNQQIIIPIHYAEFTKKKRKSEILGD